MPAPFLWLRLGALDAPLRGREVRVLSLSLLWVMVVLKEAVRGVGFLEADLLLLLV